jgi:hypothetical protein
MLTTHVSCLDRNGGLGSQACQGDAQRTNLLDLISFWLAPLPMTSPFGVPMQR